MEVLKNLSNDKKAWQLIKESGVMNTKGDAQISKKHCNFLLTMEKRIHLILKLIHKVQQTVNERQELILN